MIEKLKEAWSTILQRIDFGRKAHELMNNEVFKTALTNVENNIISSWKDAPLRDKEALYDFKHMIAVIDAFKRELNIALNDAELAKEEKELIERQEKVKITAGRGYKKT